MHRAAVNSHAALVVRLGPQRLTDFQRAFHWLFHRTGENERHPITGWKNNKLSRCFGFAHCFGLANNLVQLLQRLCLLIDEQLRVADNVIRTCAISSRSCVLVVRHSRQPLGASTAPSSDLEIGVAKLADFHLTKSPALVGYAFREAADSAGAGCSSSSSFELSSSLAVIR